MLIPKNKKTVIITGASSGIGLECAKLFHKNNYFVIGFGTDNNKLSNLGKQLFKNKNFLSIALDFSDQDIENKIKLEIAKINKIDALVNCAGLSLKNSIDNIDLQEWQKIMKVNVDSAFLMIKYSIPLLALSNYPSIVNVSSIAGRLRSISLGCHYSTSKAALFGLTRHMAGELGSKNIRVNCVAPSQTHSPMLDTALSRSGQEMLAESIPLGRLANAKEQADVIYFLCKEDSSYINGAIIDVNGGQL